jgi:hypothetical protein
LAPSPAAADHIRYLVNDPEWNYDSHLPGINQPWVSNGLVYNVCTDWNPVPPEVAAAITDWDGALPKAQFQMACATGPTFEIRRQSVRQTTVCPDAVGCYQQVPATEVYTQDLQRDAYYITHPIVWINDDPGQGGFLFSQDGLGLRATVAHELGHVFGLNEAYHHGPPTSCNWSFTTTVMNALQSQNGTVTNGCTGVYQPTATDIADVVEIYDNDVAPSVPIIYTKGADIIGYIQDWNVAESYIVILVERWNGFAWSVWEEVHMKHDVGSWGTLQTFVYRPDSSAPAGYYSLCAYAWSGLYTGPDDCSSSVYLIPFMGSLGDTDGDGFSDRDEAGWPMCYGNLNDDLSPYDLDVNDGCPAYGALKEVGTQCYYPNVVDDDGGDGPVSMINDGCAQDGDFSEASLRIGTLHTDRCDEGPESGPSVGWPLDFVSGGLFGSTDRVLMDDFNTFLTGPRRLDSSPGDPNFDVRWDLVPGPGIFTSWINVADLTAMYTGITGYPPMFGGQRALNGPACTAG